MTAPIDAGLAGAAKGALASLFLGVIVIAYQVWARWRHKNHLRANQTKKQTGLNKLISFSEPAEEFYASALTEIEEGRPSAGLWAKCLSEGDGDVGKATARYIKRRAEQLSSENSVKGEAVESAPIATRDRRPTGLTTMQLLGGLVVVIVGIVIVVIRAEAPAAEAPAAEAPAEAPAAAPNPPRDTSKDQATETEFNRDFRCPETLENEDQRAQALADMLKWYFAHNKSVNDENVNAKNILSFRMKVLEEHHCDVTLENIRRNSATTANQESKTVSAPPPAPLLQSQMGASPPWNSNPLWNCVVSVARKNCSVIKDDILGTAAVIVRASNVSNAQVEAINAHPHVQVSGGNSMNDVTVESVPARCPDVNIYADSATCSLK